MTASSGAIVALLDSLTLPETITIVVIALMVLGPEKLPGMARTLGEWMQKLRRISANLQAEVRDVMDDPAMQPIRELGEFAAQPRRKLTEYALAAESEVEMAAASQGEAPVPEEPMAEVDETNPGDATTPIVATGPDHPMERLSPPLGAEAPPTTPPADES